MVDHAPLILKKERGWGKGEITKSRHAHASFICVSRYPNEKRQPPALRARLSRLSTLAVTRLLVFLFFFPPAFSRSFSFRSSASRALRVAVRRAQHPLSVLMQASQQCGIHSARLSLNTNAHRDYRARDSIRFLIQLFSL